jgi:hypothetical protein
MSYPPPEHYQRWSALGNLLIDSDGPDWEDPCVGFAKDGVTAQLVADALNKGGIRGWAHTTRKVITLKTRQKYSC